MFLVVAAFIIASAVCYLFLRRAVSNFGDPLIFVDMAIPFSAALLTFLCISNLVSWDKLGLFTLVTVVFFVGGRIATAFFSREEFRQALERTVSRLSRPEIYCILIVSTGITLVLSHFAIETGGQGDNRQEFNRAFRPIVTLNGGFSLFSLLALLSPKLSKKEVFIWFILQTVPSIAFSGKSILLPVFFWFGLKFFVNKKRASLATIAILILGLFLGVGMMGLIAYGASESADIFLLIAGRLWLAGDVYIYAYQRNGLEMAQGDYHVSFLAYMLHPITALVGIRGYDRPLGAMLASETLHTPVLTGPNPHLPVLLDFFFPGQFLAIVLISLIIGFMVIGIRAFGIYLAKSRSRYLALGGVAAAVYCPAFGFNDTSLSLITLIGILAATSCCVVLEMLFPRRLQRASAVRASPMLGD